LKIENLKLKIPPPKTGAVIHSDIALFLVYTKRRLF